MTLNVQLCVPRDGRDGDAARRAGPSAAAESCLVNQEIGKFACTRVTFSVQTRVNGHIVTFRSRCLSF